MVVRITTRGAKDATHRRHRRCRRRDSEIGSEVAMKRKKGVPGDDFGGLPDDELDDLDDEAEGDEDLYGDDEDLDEDEDLDDDEDFDDEYEEEEYDEDELDDLDEDEDEEK
jgi:hypothetical protein